MSGQRGRRLQYAAACALLVVYAALSHYCNATGRARTMGAALAVAPLLGVGLTFMWRAAPSWLAALATAAAAAVLYRSWPALEHDFALIALLEESGLYGMLGLTFGRSLSPHRLALCTHLADQAHGPLSASEIRYTRQVTAAWTLFFAAVCATSIVLFIAAPLRIWSVFSNFCIIPLVGAMFVAESWVRRRVVPRAHTGVLATLRGYLATRPS